MRRADQRHAAVFRYVMPEQKVPESDAVAADPADAQRDAEAAVAAVRGPVH